MYFRSNRERALGSIRLIVFQFLLLRLPFFNMMKDWNLVMFIVSLSAAILSAVFGKGLLANFAWLGYFCGYLAGRVFEKKSLDPGGGTLSNSWIIWTFVLLVFLVLGIVAERLAKNKDRKSHPQKEERHTLSDTGE